MRGLKIAAAVVAIIVGVLSCAVGAYYLFAKGVVGSQLSGTGVEGIFGGVMTGLAIYEIAVGLIYLIFGCIFLSKKPQKGIAIVLLVISAIGLVGMFFGGWAGLGGVAVFVLSIIYIVKLGHSKAAA